MAKHTNVVRFKVKAGHQAEFESIFRETTVLDGRLLHILAKTGDQTYVGYGLWESERHMRAAMPAMIDLLDSTRHLLDEWSPELGVTDPVSGSVVFEG